MMRKDNEQRVTVESGGSVGSITQIIRIGIPIVIIVSVILIALTMMTGYDLRPVIDTVIFGATPTPTYPLCTVTVAKDQCLMISNTAANNGQVYGCLPDGSQIQVTGIANPYYQISAYGIEEWINTGGGRVVASIEQGSPAQTGGMMVGDVILRIGNLAVNPQTVSEIGYYAEQNVGKPIEIIIERRGKERILIVTPREPIKKNDGGYYPGYAPIGFTHYESANGAMTRGYVQGYSVSQSLKSLVETNINITSYVSCPTQLIQPNLVGQ